MQPIDAVQKRGGVIIFRLDLADRAVRPVVDDLRRTLRISLFAKIDAHPVAAADNLAHVDAPAAQRVDACVRDGIERQLGEELSVVAELRKRHRNVRLASAVHRLVAVRLNDALVPGRLKPEHDLPCGQDLFHALPPLTAAIFATSSRAVFSTAPKSPLAAPFVKKLPAPTA